MHVIILVDLLRLPAHDIQGGRGSPSSRAFGISFAPMFERDLDSDQIPDIFRKSDTIDALARRVGPLVPPCWKYPVDIGVWGFDENKKTYVRLTVGVTVLSLPPSRDLLTADLDTIKQRMIDHCYVRTRLRKPDGTVTNDPDPTTVTSPGTETKPGSKDLPANAFLYPAFLHSAAAWPAPIPHGAMNLVRFFRIDADQLTKYSTIVAAPLFSVATGGDFTQVDDPDGKDDPANVVYKSKWDFDIAPQTVVRARCNRCPIQVKASVSSFLDVNTLWLRDKLPSGPDGVSPDAWFEQLPERLGDCFDLAARIVSVLGTRDQPLISPRAELRRALIDQAKKQTPDLVVRIVLRTLHDRLGPVWNGNDTAFLASEGALVHRLLKSLIEGNDQFKIDGPVLLGALEKNFPALLTAERDGAKWTSDSAAANPWVGRLARRMSAISDLPSASSDFLQRLKDATVIPSDPGNAGDPFDVARLAAVVAAAMRPEFLANLLVDSWHETNLTPAENDALARLETAGLRTAIAQTTVAARVRRALLQPAWVDTDGLFKRPANDENDFALLRGNAVRSFAAYGLATLAEGGGTGVENAYSNRFLRTVLLFGAHRSSLEHALNAEAEKSLGDLSRSFRATNGPVLAGHSPGGITIQLDRLVRGPSSGGSQDDDFNQNLSGYAILARRKVPDGRTRSKRKRLANQPEPWRGLSIVNLGLGEDTFEPLNEVGPARKRTAKRSRVAPKPLETVVALTPGYDGALPMAAVNYDNAPLVGKAMIARRAADDRTDDQKPLIVPLQPLPGYTGNPSQAARLPFLAFGLDVEIAAFAVTNHGAIPRDLARDDFPALLVDDRDALKDSPYIRKIPYRRRVAVGPLGLSENLLKPDAMSWNGFSVDPATRLLSDELPETGLPARVAFDPNQPTQRPMPRALLLADSTTRPSQNKNQTTFKVRAPSVDIEVFDRWIAYDEFVASDTNKTKIRNYRKKIRNNFDAVATELQKVPFKNTYSLGDPVVSAFVVRATRVFNGGASDNYKEEKYADWTLPLTNYPDDTHRAPFDVKLQISANPPAARLSVSPVSLQIAAGEVWKVELYAGIDPQFVAARFDLGLFQGRELWQAPADGKRFYLVSPFIFALEGGSTDMPTAQQIYDWFTPRVLPEGDNRGGIEFKWDRQKTLAAAAVGALNIGWQQWRSTGRPASAFPYCALGDLNKLPPDPVPDPLPDPLAYPLLWELEAFADRPDEPSQGRRFEPKLLPKSNPALLGAEQPASGGPARYFRYQVSAESRYARLYNPILPPVAGSLKSPSGAWSTNWKRLFRPAMPTAVPSLSVRAVLPLTRSVDPGATPQGRLGGILVVVNGAVGEAGGLAEGVEVRAVQIVRQLQPSFDDKAATEFGADPILRLRGRADTAVGRAVSLGLTGPIGHTFDFDARAPAFAASSFIVAAPDFAQTDPGAGWMAKLRARRILDPRAVAGGTRVPIPGPRKHRTANGPAEPLPLSGDGDLSLTFTDLPLRPGPTIKISLTADRPGDGAATARSQQVPTQQDIVLTAHDADDSHPKPWAAIDFGSVVAEATSPSAIRLLVTRRRIQRSGMPVDHFEVTLEAIDSTGAIVRAGEVSFEDETATGAVRLGIAPSAAVTLDWLRAPLASDWSETGWTQFLPDSSVAMRNSAGQAVELILDLNGDTIRATADIKADWLTFLGLADRAGKENQGLVHFLLLMRDIPSSTGGQNEEAYVGLYVLEKSATDTTADFVRFGQDGDPTPTSSANLRGRILAVQADPRVWRDSSKAKKSKRHLATWLSDVTKAWDKFFKPEEQTLGRELAEPNARGALLAPKDTDLRIFTMYAPFGPSKAGS
ncbi:hypothetical protein [Bradyrhizobium oligotrophicum]|uniref:hypothetical protein n=1 Tax=Bradyrhizobium oligotrophicum TaxID=44255 RepID=UPI003EBE9B9F